MGHGANAESEALAVHGVVGLSVALWHGRRK